MRIVIASGRYYPNCGEDMDRDVDYCSLACWNEFVADPAGAWINQAF